MGPSLARGSEIRVRVRKHGMGEIVGDLLALVRQAVTLAELLDRRQRDRRWYVENSDSPGMRQGFLESFVFSRSDRDQTEAGDEQVD